MKFNIKQELPSIGILLIPFIYLYYIWSDLPAKVPVHWNMSGEIDRYGNKAELILVAFILPVLTYLIFLVIPLLDPKKKIQLMGDKYHKLKFLVVLITSLLTLVIIYSSHKQVTSDINIVFGILSVLFIVIGNYMKNMRQNYFMGIRTPWTLENEQVWREVHHTASYLWVVGGMLLLLLSLIVPFEPFAFIFFSITLLIAVGPIVHSYILYKKYVTNV
jgi:uncharacterized membrane protein